YTPIDATLIPTGTIAPVTGTPLDFTRPTPIGERIGTANEQIKRAGGYDFNYVLDGGGSATPALAAEAYDPVSGRQMRIYTTQPGLQFYSGNFLKGERGKHGHRYDLHSGFALETQHFPDSPNHANFPSTELKPGETYHQITIYRFDAH
ncbi:MAG TPA: galactose-1-epimerase, partial [Terriglobales bacterium]|nr:galactose-1-epimerase [Terriglobales bacterium]